MTLPVNDRRVGPLTGGPNFPFDFKVFAKADIKVVLTTATGVESTLTLDSDYTVTLNGDQDNNPGGTVAYTLAVGNNITILGNVTFSQGQSLPNGGGWFPKNVEDALDRLTMIAQQLGEQVNRAILLPVASTLANLIMPNPSPGQFLRGRADGQGWEHADITGIGAIGVPVPINQGGTGGATVAQARANLDVPSNADIAALLLPPAYFSGFSLSNNATDAARDIDVGAGNALDSTATFNLRTSATIVKQTDVAFAEYVAPPTASGGMDSTTPLTGSPASVHIFMIGGAGKNTQPFFSTNINPALPAGFTKKLYVNSLLWDGTAMRPFKQRGRDEIELVTPVTSFSAFVTVTTGNPATLTVPTGIELLAKIAISLVCGTTADVAGISPLDRTDLSPTGVNDCLFDVVAEASVNGFDASGGYTKTNTSGQVRYRVVAGGIANKLSIGTMGWRVMR